jgi:hypothetical protein
MLKNITTWTVHNAVLYDYLGYEQYKSSGKINNYNVLSKTLLNQKSFLDVDVARAQVGSFGLRIMPDRLTKMDDYIHFWRTENMINPNISATFKVTPTLNNSPILDSKTNNTIIERNTEYRISIPTSLFDNQPDCLSRLFRIDTCLPVYNIRRSMNDIDQLLCVP